MSASIVCLYVCMYVCPCMLSTLWCMHITSSRCACMSGLPVVVELAENRVIICKEMSTRKWKLAEDADDAKKNKECQRKMHFL